MSEHTQELACGDKRGTNTGWHRHYSAGKQPACTECVMAQRAYAKVYADKNREVMRERVRKYRADRPGYGAEYAAKYRADNREKRAAYNKQYATEHKAEGAANQARYRERHPNRRRELDLRRKYNLTPAEYDAMLAEQSGQCAICDKPPSTGKPLFVDHDHDTGEVRGLLCSRCNWALGQLGDGPELVARALSYLTQSTRSKE